jgi:hypothetical protein
MAINIFAHEYFPSREHYYTNFNEASFKQDDYVCDNSKVYYNPYNDSATVLFSPTRNEVRPITSYSCQVWDDMLYIRETSESNIKLTVVGKVCIPCHTHKITIKVEVKPDGTINGTNIQFEKLILNIAAEDPNNYGTSDSWILRSRRGEQIFSRRLQSQSVEVFTPGTNQSMIMEEMDDILWLQLGHLIKADHQLNESSRPLFSEVVTHETTSTTRFLDISVGIEKLAMAINAGIEALQSYQELDSLDQLVLLKEGLSGGYLLMLAHAYERESDSFVFCVFCQQVFCHLSRNVTKVDSLTKHVENALSLFLDTFFDFLRKDAFLMMTLSIICVFQESTVAPFQQMIENRRQTCSQVLDKYIKAKINCGEWNFDYHSIIENIQQAMNQVENFRKRQVYDRLAAEREKIIISMKENKREDRDNSIVFVKTPVGSGLVYQVRELVSIPCCLVKGVVEVEASNGIIKGTDCLIDTLVREQMDWESPPVNTMQVTLLSRYQEKTLFTRNVVHCDQVSISRVNLTERSQTIQSTMTGMTQQFFHRLQEVVTAAKRFHKTFEFKHELSKSLQGSVNDNPSKIRLNLTVSWETIVKAVTRAFDAVSFLDYLKKTDREILQREAIPETVCLQRVANYDSHSNSVVHYGINNHLLVNVKFEIFEKVADDQNYFRLFYKIVTEFDNVLRKDEFVMTILCILTLLKERHGMSEVGILLVREERTLFLDLLDKYITGNIISGEWTSKCDLIWNRIHTQMTKVSDLKTLFENVALSKYH